MAELQVASEDREFRELLLRTAEFEPGDRFFDAYLHFNLAAVDRGAGVVRLLDRFHPVTGSTSLDIGAGSGGMSIALGRAGARVFAIEPDETRRSWARARCRGHGVNVDLRPDVAEQLTFADETFDIVTVDSVFEHVKELEAAICECCRVLKPGGLIYSATPNKASLLNIWRDPHYFMFGVVLMPHRFGKWYVERVRKNSRGYWVYRIPTRGWLRSRFRRHRVELARIVPPSFEKLSDPASIRGHPFIAKVARIFRALRLTRLLHKIALHQDPTNAFIGRKSSV
jgi:2-polyprenyl-3-methyl-5-hydroxy-6-metoxy-1,4-benzoquinol methylase